MDAVHKTHIKKKRKKLHEIFLRSGRHLASQLMPPDTKLTSLKTIGTVSVEQKKKGKAECRIHINSPTMPTMILYAAKKFGIKIKNKYMHLCG